MKKDCQDKTACGKIKAVEGLNQFYELHKEISEKQGQISGLQDEIDRVTRKNLDRIRQLRYEAKQKQRELKATAERFGADITQLITN